MKAATGLSHALAVGTLTVLLLAASNVDRGVTFTDLLPPLGLAFLAGVFSWVTAALVARHRTVRGPVAALLTLGLLLYGYVWAPLERLLPLGSNTSSLVGLALFAGTLVLFLARVRRIAALNREVSRGLALALVAMIAVSVLAVVRGGFGDTAVTEEWERPPFVGSTKRVESLARPDIFLIVLDAYSRSDHIREIYGYDNSRFESELRRRGFQIPSRARANYAATFLAMAALLNWDYLDALAPVRASEWEERSPVYELVENNRTVRFLKRIGYEFVYLRSSYPAMASNRLADLELPESVEDQFAQMYASKTVLLPLVKAHCLLTRCLETRWPFTPEGPGVIAAKFDYLGELGDHDSPRFVLAHFLLPHEPFRLDSTCAPIEPLWPSTFDGVEEAKVRTLYPQQVACANRKVLESIDQILSAGRDPIILVQADHGYGRLPWGRTGPMAETDPDRVRERMAVFAAYRFPGPDAPEVPMDITPVNVFRLVLSSYFGREDLAPVEDVSWWSAWEKPFDFERVPTGPGEMEAQSQAAASLVADP